MITQAPPVLKQRKMWVDVLRALAIIFVIFGHQFRTSTAFFVFTSPIKIPLFFMITGYVFNYKRTSTTEFFKNLFFKLVIPWLILTLPVCFAEAFLDGASISDYGNVFLDVISGKEAWYMPCCILAEIIWFFTHRISKKPVITSIIAVALCAFGLIAARFEVLDFAMLNRAMTAQIFILLGYIYKINSEKISKLSWTPRIVIVLVYVAMGVISMVVWPEQAIDVHLNRYYNLPFCFALIAVGCVAMFVVAEKAEEKLSKFLKPLAFVGQNTLVYYLLHSISLVVFNVAISTVLKISIPHNFIGGCILTLAACIMCAIEAMILNRFFPFAVGKKRKPRKADK